MPQGNNRSQQSNASEDTKGRSAKDYIVRKDPDIRGAGKARSEEADRWKRRDGGDRG